MSFKKAAASVARNEGISEARADAIIASGARKASAKAQRRNPKLLKVAGVKKKPLHVRVK